MTATSQRRANGSAGNVGTRNGGRKPRETTRALPIALLRAREVVMVRFRPFVASAGLTDQQWRVLRILNEFGPLDPTQIAQHACILMPSLSRMLKSLEEAGHIARQGHPDDKRSTIISITRSAEKMLVRLAPKSNAIYEELERAYGKRKMRQLLDLLEDLALLDDG